MMVLSTYLLLNRIKIRACIIKYDVTLGLHEVLNLRLTNLLEWHLKTWI